MNAVDRLWMWEIDWPKKYFSVLLRCSEKNLRKWVSYRVDIFREGSLKFFFSIASNYGDIFSFPNKLKFDDNNICLKLLIREQKIINNNCPSNSLICLKSYIWMLKHFALLRYNRELQVTRDNILHRKRIYLQKHERSIFKHNVKAFRNSP